MQKQNLKEFWKNALKKLEPTISRQNFVTWFDKTAVLEIKNATCVLGVPSIFAKDWIMTRYHLKILQSLQELDPSIQDLSYEVHTSLTDNDDIRSFRVNKEDVKSLKANKKNTQGRKLPGKEEVNVGGIRSKRLNAKYSLSNFVVGQNNRLAHAAASAIAHKPGQNYNPLFIYGDVGLGKTHLLHAIGNGIVENYPNASVVYSTAENFMNEVVEGIRKYSMAEVKKKYRNIDCLIVDDIQFLGGGERTQEEFFHTFNELYDNQKQIILSSDRPPRELKGIEDRLRSRFEMGMMVDVNSPDYETRLAILQMKAMEQEAILPSEVLEFIAYNIQDNVRTLEGILLQAIAKAKLENTTPTVKMVARYINKFDSKNDLDGFDIKNISDKTNARTIDDVLNIVSEYYRISRSDMRGDLRKREVLMPRQITMYLCRNELNQSFEKIGLEFGGKNHTTVMHAVDKIQELLKKDHTLVRDVNAIKREMGL